MRFNYLFIVLLTAFLITNICAMEIAESNDKGHVLLNGMETGKELILKKNDQNKGSLIPFPAAFQYEMLQEIAGHIDNTQDFCTFKILSKLCYAIGGKIVNSTATLKKLQGSGTYTIRSQDPKYYADLISEAEPLIFTAIRMRAIDWFKKVIVDDKNATDQKYKGMRLLHYMAECNISEEVVQSWLDHQAKELFNNLFINQGDIYKRTPLHYAQSKKFAELLINRGASVNHADGDGRTPLHTAATDGIAKLLISKGADVHCASQDGMTPLHHARKRGIAQVLIANGADVNQIDNGGLTPLRVTWREKVAQQLIDSGADVNQIDKKGFAALHLCYSAKMAQLFLDNHANINIKDPRGRTPLHRMIDLSDTPVNNYEQDDLSIIINYRCEVAKVLIKNGAALNESDIDGRTALHLAAQYANLKCLKLLLKYGADKNVTNNQGKTPLDILKNFKNLISYLKNLSWPARKVNLLCFGPEMRDLLESDEPAPKKRKLIEN